MKKTYSKLKLTIENPADVVTTSPEVETGRIQFPTVFTALTYINDETVSTEQSKSYNLGL